MVNETTELIMKQLNSKKVHAETHEQGGADEIDALKLKNVGSLASVTHATRHEQGGADEIDALKLKNISQVTALTVADGAITASKVASGALTADKFVPGALTNDTQNGLNIVALKAETASQWINAKYPPVPLVAAKGDGVTDDAPAIQAVIDYLSSNGGGIIKLPKGTYILKTSLKWKSNVSMFGNGVGLSILRPYEQTSSTTGFAAIEWDSASTSDTNPMVNCVFTNFEINGIDMTISSYTSIPKGIVIHYMKDCIFKDMLIRNTCATGLGVDFLKNVTIDNVTTINCGRSWVDTGTEQNVGGAGIGIGTKRMPGESFVIRNCIADGNGNYGIFLEDQGFVAVSQAADACYIITNNIVKNGRNIGIATKGGDRTIISNNVVYNNLSSGIAVIENNGFTLDNCFISNNITTKNKRGIYINCKGSVKNLKVQGNDVSKNIEHGILATGNDTVLTNVLLENNTVYENLAGIVLTVVLHSEFIKIKNNNVVGNYQNGIALISTTNSIDTVTIEGNDILNNNRNNSSDNTLNNGLYLDVFSKNMNIKSNIVGNSSSSVLYTKNQKNGLNITNTSILTDSSIQGNVFSQNSVSDTIYTLGNFAGNTKFNELLNKTSSIPSGDYSGGVQVYGTKIYDTNLTMFLISKETFWYTETGAKVIDEALTVAADQVADNVIFNPITKLYRKWNGTAWVNAHIPNLLSNGNFATGTTGWSSATVSGFSVANSEASFTANAAGGNIFQAPSGGSVVGRMYYVVADVTVLSNLVVVGFGATTKAHTGGGTYEKLSLIHTATTTGHTASIKDNRSSAWTVTKAKNVMVIDLTANYGAGNEPTLVWCDANIPFRV